MRNPVDPMPPLPRIYALDPEEAEQSWDSAPQLLAALNAARLGAWCWEIDTGRISWSRGTQALFGFDPRQPLPKDLEYLDLLAAARPREPGDTRLSRGAGRRAVRAGHAPPHPVARWQPALAGNQRQPGAGQNRPAPHDRGDPRDHPPARTGTRPEPLRKALRHAVSPVPEHGPARPASPTA